MEQINKVFCIEKKSPSSINDEIVDIRKIIKKKNKDVKKNDQLADVALGLYQQYKNHPKTEGKMEFTRTISQPEIVSQHGKKEPKEDILADTKNQSMYKDKNVSIEKHAGAIKNTLIAIAQEQASLEKIKASDSTVADSGIKDIGDTISLKKIESADHSFQDNLETKSDDKQMLHHQFMSNREASHPLGNTALSNMKNHESMKKTHAQFVPVDVKNELIYKFNSWGNKHSVRIDHQQFNADSRILLQPSSNLVEKRLHENVNVFNDNPNWVLEDQDQEKNKNRSKNELYEEDDF